MRVPPPITGDWRQWAQALQRALQAGQSQLAARNADSSAAEDGNLIWDRSGKYPVVSRDDEWIPLATADAIGFMTADYTLTSTTAAQKLFNWSANGALTLQTGRYRYLTWFVIEDMSATSGNAQFLLGGTATVNGSRGVVMGGDTTAPLTTVGSVSGQFFSGTATGASMVTATTGTGIGAIIQGTFNVATAGTVIPQVALVTAAAATVKAGSWFECRRVSSTTTVGAWT